MEKNMKAIFTVLGIVIVSIIVIIGLILYFPSAEKEAKGIVKHANPGGGWDVVDYLEEYPDNTNSYFYMKKELKSHTSPIDEDIFYSYIENIVRSPHQIWIYKENPVEITSSCNHTSCNGTILLGKQSDGNIDNVQEIYVRQYLNKDQTSTMTIEMGSPGNPQLGNNNE